MAYSFWIDITNPCIGDSILIVKRLKISNPIKFFKIAQPIFFYSNGIIDQNFRKPTSSLYDSHLACFDTNRIA
jgi:hypothetical protein